MTDDNRPPRPPRKGRPGAPAGDRPSRGPRSFSGKPDFSKSRSDKPGGGRGFKSRDGDGPRGEGERKPFRPREERAFEHRPRTARSRDDQPAGERGFEKRGDRLRGDGERTSYGERKPFRPREDRPFGDRPPRSPRAFGDKPGFRGGSGSKGGPRGGFRDRDEGDRADKDGNRIAKVMARAGLCSRRDAEEWIAAGRVTVDGKVIDSPALDVLPGQKILVDGKPLPEKEKTRLWLFNKPPGLVTTEKDPEGRPTVFDNLPPELPRVVSIGRLDINTEGLLLLTNDGGLARVLGHPKTGWLRRYRVRAYGRITQEDLNGLADGISIDGMDYGPVEASLDKEQGDNVWLTLGLREGKNREVKRILEHLGLQVNRLIRVSFGPFKLEDLAEGAVEEVRTKILKDQLGERLAEEAEVDFDGPTRFSPRPAKRAEPQRGPRAWREDESAPSDRAPKYKRRLDKEGFAERRRAAVLGETEDFKLERATTADRRGKAVKVERIVKTRPETPALDDEASRAERAAEGEFRPRKPRFRPDGDRSDRDRRQDQRRDTYGSGAGERSGRPPRRDFGDRPPRKDFGDRPPRREFSEGGRPPRREFGDRPPRKDFGDRPPRREFSEGGRPPRREFGDRPPRKDFGDRPPRAGGFKPGGPRSDGPRGGAPRGGAPRGGASGGFGSKGRGPAGGGRRDR